MALLVPLLLLTVVEVFLRISGYGYSTGFFLKQRVNGREVLTDNQRFGWRFFPRDIARTPQPVMFSPHKAPGTARLFVFGESAAMGDPEPAFGLSRVLQAMLELKFPSNKFEVINVAMTAINSHVIREIAKDCAPLEGDVWIIYMGNNEVVGPFGGGTIFGPQTPSLAFIRTSLWLKRFRVVQLLSSFREHGPAEWSGMEMFLKQQVQRDDPRLAKVNAYFRENLDEVIAAGEKAGAKVLLGAPVVNLRDCPPFASQHDLNLTTDQKVEFGNELRKSVALLDAGKNQQAQALLSGLLKRHTTVRLCGCAEIYFQLARCELACGSNATARALFGRALSNDTLRFRATSDLAEIVRERFVNSITSKPLVDTESAFKMASSNGIPGSEFFYEHVHFNFDGTYLLAGTFFDELVKTLPASVTAHSTAGVPSMEDCARRLAWTDWDRLQIFEEMRQRLQQAPFMAQHGHATRDAEWKRRVDELRVSLTPQKVQRIVDDYTAAIRVSPTDRLLRENFARLLEWQSETARALEQWREVTRLLPHDPEAYEHIGHLLDTLGASAEAMPFFREALRLVPDSADAHFNYGASLVKMGKFVEAAREFSLTLKLNPNHPHAKEMLKRAKQMK